MNKANASLASLFSPLPHNKSGRGLTDRLTACVAVRPRIMEPLGSVFAVASPPLENKPIMTRLVCLSPTHLPSSPTSTVTVISAPLPREASTPPPLCVLHHTIAVESVSNGGCQVTLLVVCESVADVCCYLFCFCLSLSLSLFWNFSVSSSISSNKYKKKRMTFDG